MTANIALVIWQLINSTNTMINFELEEDLRPNLSSGEKLIWTGKPKTGIVFRISDIFMIPFSFLWAGFALFWEGGTFSMDTPLFFKLWGIPFILVGAYITIGRFFIDAKKRANTVYGVTPDRIIIKSGIFSKSVKSLNIRTLSDITIDQKKDDTGTITLGPTDFRNSIMQGMEWPGNRQPPRLEFIEDAKSVYDKIIALQRQQ